MKGEGEGEGGSKRAGEQRGGKNDEREDLETEDL